MAKHQRKDKEEREEAKRRKKAEPIYDQLKQANELDDSHGDRVEVILGLQQCYGNRYVQRVIGQSCPINYGAINELGRSLASRLASLPTSSRPSVDSGNVDIGQQSQAALIIQRQAGSGKPSSTPHPTPNVEEMEEEVRILLEPSSVQNSLLNLPLDLTVPYLPFLPTIPSTEESTAPEPKAGSVTPRSALVEPKPPKPKAGTTADVLKAITADPVVATGLKALQTKATEQVKRDFKRLSTGEKIAALSMSAVIAGGAVGGILSNPESRRFVFDQLNGRVLPVPGVTGLGVEFNTKGDNLMLGLHLDVGALLPPSWGFGPSSPKPIGAPPAAVQRQEALEEKVSDESQQDHAYVVSPAVAAQIEKECGAGMAMEPKTRSEMEAAFKQDFGGVRIHADATADKLAEDLDAKAFTSGKDIFFREGAYQPDTEIGISLVAHELTHIVQQQAVPAIQRQAAKAPAKKAAGKPEVTAKATVTYGKWVTSAGAWRYNKLRNQLEAAGYKFINHVATEASKWEKGFPKEDTPASMVGWAIGSPDGKWFWATTSDIVTQLEKLVAELPTKKAEAEPKIKMLKDPEAQTKDPNLVADTPEGVAFLEKAFAESAVLVIKGKRMTVDPGTKFGNAVFICRIGGNVYYKWGNTIRLYPASQFESAVVLGEIAERVYRSTKIWIPIASYTALAVIVTLRPDLALDVAGNLMAGKSIVDEEAFRGYCASALFAPLGKIKAGGKLVGKATDILVDVVKAAGESAFKQLMAEGKLKPGQLTEDILKSAVSSQIGKHIAKLPNDSKKVLEEVNDRLREVAGGLISKEAEAAYEVGKEVATK